MAHSAQKVSGIVLGHHALLSIAEVFAQTKNTTVFAASKDAMVIASDTDLVALGDYMGGIQKIATDVVECPTEELLACATQVLFTVLYKQRHRKLPFAVSCYGTADGMQRMLLKGLKEALKKDGALGRFVNKDLDTNVSNVFVRNQLMKRGVDLVIIGHGDKCYVGTTAWVQDIDTYARRDIKKPRRDMATGMLPPKLAQTLINLTLPHVESKLPCIWDPFCGLGVIPMEALLMGFPVVASDINPEMEENTLANLQWLTSEGDNVPPFAVSTMDARHWATLPTVDDRHPDCIVTEGTLGLNFQQQPTLEEAEREQDALAALYEDFFHGLARPEAGTIQALTLTIPFHITKEGEYLRLLPRLLPTMYAQGFTTAEIIPHSREMLRQLGLLEAWTNEHTILYTRSKQYVGREIVVLKRA